MPAAREGRLVRPVEAGLEEAVEWLAVAVVVPDAPAAAWANLCVPVRSSRRLDQPWVLVESARKSRSCHSFT